MEVGDEGTAVGHDSSTFETIAVLPDGNVRHEILTRRLGAVHDATSAAVSLERKKGASSSIRASAPSMRNSADWTAAPVRHSMEKLSVPMSVLGQNVEPLFNCMAASAGSGLVPAAVRKRVGGSSSHAMRSADTDTTERKLSGDVEGGMDEGGEEVSRIQVMLKGRSEAGAHSYARNQWLTVLYSSLLMKYG